MMPRWSRIPERLLSRYIDRNSSRNTSKTSWSNVLFFVDEITFFIQSVSSVMSAIPAICRMLLSFLFVIKWAFVPAWWLPRPLWDPHEEDKAGRGTSRQLQRWEPSQVPARAHDRVQNAHQQGTYLFLSMETSYREINIPEFSYWHTIMPIQLSRYLRRLWSFWLILVFFIIHYDTTFI